MPATGSDRPARPLVIFLTAIDRLQRFAFVLSQACTAVLIALMLFEVFKRYVLGAPSIWSFELVAILNGAVFVLAAGHALQTGGHVSVDALARFVPSRFHRLFLGIFYLAVFAPLLLYIVDAGLVRALAAFARGEVDDVSPWRHVVWPHYALLTAGFACFAAAALARGLRLLAGGTDG
ncbi:MAG: TRAP transporter small permease [Proteobacteria bacterium]|nr:TRAP transporter small permease [Pseudomonadota bacterium]